MVEFGLIDSNMVYEMMGGVVIRYWNARKIVIEETQKADPHYGENVEYLYNEMVKLSKVRHPERDIVNL